MENNNGEYGHITVKVNESDLDPFNVKIGQSVRIEYKGKIIPAKVHKIGKHSTIDVEVNGKYYFCPEYDIFKGVFVGVKFTKRYNYK